MLIVPSLGCFVIDLIRSRSHSFNGGETAASLLFELFCKKMSDFQVHFYHIAPRFHAR